MSSIQSMLTELAKRADFRNLEDRWLAAIEDEKAEAAAVKAAAAESVAPAAVLEPISAPPVGTPKAAPDA